MLLLARPLSFLACTLLPLTLGAQVAEDTLPPPVASPIRDRILAPTTLGIRWPDIRDVSAEVLRAYQRVNWGPLWTNGGRPSLAAQSVVRLLGQADSLGLEPKDFDSRLLDSLLAQGLAEGLDGDARLRFEAVLSVATARTLSALRWGRVRQDKAYPLRDTTHDAFDLAEGIFAVARSSEPGAVFDQAAPQWAPYRQLVQAIPALQRSARDTVLRANPARRGTAFPLASHLRLALSALGVATDSTPPAEADTLLDASLAQALTLFQRNVKLPRTGHFDVTTRDRLRAELQQRVRASLVSLERWRWLPRKGEGPSIIVNVPEFRLRVYDSLRAGAVPAFAMKVVVGKGEEDRYTPLFVDELEHLIFSPYWEVPTSIATKEIIPKALADPTYLSRNRYILVRGTSATAKPLPTDSATIMRIGKSVRVRQLPGDYNSLGRIKFMLPNSFNIYLHDTNEKGFFRRDARALSHGCIRVSEPTKLAQWILRSDTAWTPQRMKEAMKQDEPEKVQLESHVPVFIVYHTAFATDDGKVQTFKDVYKYDDDLYLRLSRGYPYPR